MILLEGLVWAKFMAISSENKIIEGKCEIL